MSTKLSDSDASTRAEVIATFSMPNTAKVEGDILIWYKSVGSKKNRIVLEGITAGDKVTMFLAEKDKKSKKKQEIKEWKDRGKGTFPAIMSFDDGSFRILPTSRDYKKSAFELYYGASPIKFQVAGYMRRFESIVVKTKKSRTTNKKHSKKIAAAMSWENMVKLVDGMQGKQSKMEEKQRKMEEKQRKMEAAFKKKTEEFEKKMEAAFKKKTGEYEKKMEAAFKKKTEEFEKKMEAAVKKMTEEFEKKMRDMEDYVRHNDKWVHDSIIAHEDSAECAHSKDFALDPFNGIGNSHVHHSSMTFSAESKFEALPATWDVTTNDTLGTHSSVNSADFEDKSFSYGSCTMNEAGLKQVVGILGATLNPKTTNAQRRQALQRLQGLKRNPEFLRYLCWIFVKGNSIKIHLSIRQSAGLHLKNCIRRSLDTIPPALMEEIKREILSCVKSPMKPIRSTAGTMVTSIVLKSELRRWPSLLPFVVPLLQSGNANECFGAFDILRKLCEDVPEQLDSDDVGRPLNKIVPILLKMLMHSSERVRSLSLQCLNHLMPTMPAAMDTNFEQLLGSISKLATDKSSDVRRRVCASINLMMDVRLVQLMPAMAQVMGFMLRSSQDQDSEVRLEATEFWSSCCMCGDAVHRLLAQILPKLLPVLLNGVLFADDDEYLEGAEDTDRVADKPSDLEPHFLGLGKSRGGDNDDDDDGDDASYQDAEGAYTVRKSSAQALDDLSLVFRGSLLPMLLPLLQPRLNHSDWRVRESAILTIGAISSGCLQALHDHISKLFPFLVRLMSDPNPLIRSICCWTLSRFADWIVQSKKANAAEAYFDKFLRAVLENVVVPNKKVQEAACSALARFCEAAGLLLSPYVPLILRALDVAFKRYQNKNLIILYDTVTTLIVELGREGISREEDVGTIARLLTGKLQSMRKHTDPMMVVNLECIGHFVRNFGLTAPVQRIARPLFARATQVVEAGLVIFASLEDAADGDFPESEHVAVGLDVLSALADGFGHNMRTLVEGSNLLNVLGHSSKVPNVSIRQSVMALVGDLARTAPAYFAPAVASFFPVLVASANPVHFDVCNNASWALGEIAFHVLRNPSFASAAPPAATITQGLVRMIQLLVNTDVDDDLRFNAAIAIGRIALVQRAAVVSRVSSFAKQWYALLRDRFADDESISAFQGMSGVVRASAGIFLQDMELLSEFFAAVATFGESGGVVPDALRHEFGAVLGQFKTALVTRGAWQGFRTAIRDPLSSRLTQLYRV
eukprot:g2981.t1